VPGGRAAQSAPPRSAAHALAGKRSERGGPGCGRAANLIRPVGGPHPPVSGLPSPRARRSPLQRGPALSPARACSVPSVGLLCPQRGPALSPAWACSVPSVGLLCPQRGPALPPAMTSCPQRGPSPPQRGPPSPQRGPSPSAARTSCPQRGPSPSAARTSCPQRGPPPPTSENLTRMGSGVHAHGSGLHPQRPVGDADPRRQLDGGEETRPPAGWSRQSAARGLGRRCVSRMTTPCAGESKQQVTG
jgi:hypothetical protein